MKRIWLIVMLLVLAAAGFAVAEEAACGEFRFVLLEDGTAQLTGYTGRDETLVIPSKLDGYAVSAIGEGAFYGCTSLTSVTISEGIASIDDYAFESCAALLKVSVPDSVVSVGRNPFVDCEKLRYIVVSAKHPALSVISGVLFSREDKRLISYPGAYTAEHYAVPQDTVVIDDLAFYGSKNLQEVSIPDSVQRIGESAFEGCSALKKVNLPQGIAELEPRTFAWCSSLTEVTIPGGVTVIGEGAFTWCRSLTRAAVPETVGTIGENAFAWCPKLMMAVRPGSAAAFWAIEQGIPFEGLI